MTMRSLADGGYCRALLSREYLHDNTMAEEYPSLVEHMGRLFPSSFASNLVRFVGEMYMWQSRRLVAS